MSDQKHPGKAGGGVAVRLHGLRDLLDAARAQGSWQITCRDEHGNVKWRDEITNLVVNEGLDYLLNTGLSGGAQITTWYLGLLSGTPTVAATDTMAAHAGWTEITAYNEAARPGWVDGGVASQSVDNSASPATFTINADSTVIGGAFLTSVNTKGGATGSLYAAGAFTGGNKTLSTSDSLDVTATFTQAAA